MIAILLFSLIVGNGVQWQQKHDFCVIDKSSENVIVKNDKYCSPIKKTYEIKKVLNH